LYQYGAHQQGFGEGIAVQLSQGSHELDVCLGTIEAHKMIEEVHYYKSRYQQPRCVMDNSVG
jgi:hypothetical protein